MYKRTHRIQNNDQYIYRTNNQYTIENSYLGLPPISMWMSWHVYHRCASWCVCCDDHLSWPLTKSSLVVSRLMNTENSIIQSREEEGGNFERTLVASEFIDWLLQEGEMATREEAEQLGRRLLEHGIIQHGEEGGRLHFGTWLEAFSSIRAHLYKSVFVVIISLTLLA